MSMGKCVDARRALALNYSVCMGRSLGTAMHLILLTPPVVESPFWPLNYNADPIGFSSATRRYIYNSAQKKYMTMKTWHINHPNGLSMSTFTSR